MVYGKGDSGTMFFDRDNKPNMLNVAVSRAKENFIFVDIFVMFQRLLDQWYSAGFFPPLLSEGAIQGGEKPENPQIPRFWTICFGNLAKKHYKFSGRLRRPERSETRGKAAEYH